MIFFFIQKKKKKQEFKSEFNLHKNTNSETAYTRTQSQIPIQETPETQ